IPDFALGALTFTMSTGGALGALGIGILANRMPRTRLLAFMFGLWTVLMGLACLSPSFSLFGLTVSGFVLFYLIMIPTSVTEATDPAALPLISDYWPLNQRASKISVFNAGAGVGGVLGITLGGVLVDQFGWRAAFAMWVPLGVVGTIMMASRREPARGLQDAAFLAELEESPEGAEALAEGSRELHAVPPAPTVTRRELARQILRLRTWRSVAIAMGVSQIMLSALGLWGPAYFKRTFHLSATRAGLLTPVLGVGAFAGTIAGGFVADRLLRRGVLRARIWVSAIGYGGAGLMFLAAFATTSLIVAAPLLAIAGTLLTLPTGPSFALLMDATPTHLREPASAVADVVMYVNAIGAPLVGGLSTLFGDNLRLALLCVSPASLVGAGLFLVARHSYLTDLAIVVTEAAEEAGR
ncbi:MAG TPA: MFS transporter, partial [Acidimicrobiales bacterium]|nr:MFS transporter [Acidimicrobiales bacterium]